MNNDLIGICTKIGISISYIDSFPDRFPDPGFGSGWFGNQYWRPIFGFGIGMGTDY